MKALTITAPIEAGEVAVFKIKPLVNIDEAMEAVEMIVSPECVLDGQEMGLWEIV